MINSNNLFILVVASSVLLLIICVNAKWSTMASKSTLLSKCEKLAICMAKLHNSNFCYRVAFCGFWESFACVCN